ncbi:hypothetical protein TIFTF001_008233 [Ficus carica]|uniref:Uncharacterized protein n=1 Tax=Ficus carica TaxID=3494 RepID=A0AA88A4F5_FICCA|nr:hypothetical protein TIFTF001_008233 [Ficus carica]
MRTSDGVGEKGLCGGYICVADGLRIRNSEDGTKETV